MAPGGSLDGAIATHLSSNGHDFVGVVGKSPEVQQDQAQVTRTFVAGVATVPGGAAVRILGDASEREVDLRSYVDLIKLAADGHLIRLDASGVDPLTVHEAASVLSLSRALEAAGFQVDVEFG